MNYFNDFNKRVEFAYKKVDDETDKREIYDCIPTSKQLKEKASALRRHYALLIKYSLDSANYLVDA